MFFFIIIKRKPKQTIKKMSSVVNFKSCVVNFNFAAPCVEPKRTGLDILDQYESDDDDETFNTKWRPTPVNRTPEVILGIDLFPTRESDRDKKTYNPAERRALRTKINSINTESEAIAYAKKEGYKVITQRKPTHRFYFKGGEKSKDHTFNKTYKEIETAVKKEQQKKVDNPEKFKDKTEAKVWIVY